MKSNDKNEEQLFEGVTSLVDDSETLDLQELRLVRKMLGHDVEQSEKDFLGRLGQLRKELPKPETAEGRKPVVGLIAMAGAIGLDVSAFADQTRLSVSLIAKLEHRLVRNVPNQVVERLAIILNLAIEELIKYFELPPALPANAAYKAKDAPSVPIVQDFFDAVAVDRSISEDRRKDLLQLKS